MATHTHTSSNIIHFSKTKKETTTIVSIEVRPCKTNAFVLNFSNYRINMSTYGNIKKYIFKNIKLYICTSYQKRYSALNQTSKQQIQNKNMQVLHILNRN